MLRCLNKLVGEERGRESFDLGLAVPEILCVCVCVCMHAHMHACVFLGPHLLHMEVPRLGVELEL